MVWFDGRTWRIIQLLWKAENRADFQRPTTPIPAESGLVGEIVWISPKANRVLSVTTA
jgi:hypothetical protein